MKTTTLSSMKVYKATVLTIEENLKLFKNKRKIKEILKSKISYKNKCLEIFEIINVKEKITLSNILKEVI
jgi:hypothetical protein